MHQVPKHGALTAAQAAIRPSVASCLTAKFWSTARLGWGAAFLVQRPLSSWLAESRVGKAGRGPEGSGTSGAGVAGLSRRPRATGGALLPAESKRGRRARTPDRASPQPKSSPGRPSAGTIKRRPAVRGRAPRNHEKRLPSLAKEGVGGGWSRRGAGPHHPCPSSLRGGESFSKQSLIPFGGRARRNHENPVILSEAKNLALIFSSSLHHGPERDSSLRSE